MFSTLLTLHERRICADPGRLEEYRARAQTAYEHTWQIRDTFGYREFSAGEEDLRLYLAARVWAGEEDPKALFDRAVLYLLEHQILLIGRAVPTRSPGTERILYSFETMAATMPSATSLGAAAPDAQ